ncbi:trehalose operon repressor [Facklamia miroungae]|uniref:Trehalose operon repressor n=1 Tax=Facklamia miroungae TaxID=120956 RepID=A0A1G7T082_9LACT|nr:trehalose operon repressor [Facklamia miroungae]NKZ29488.1 trehalose operon repressor [Facklamia miroungae]SDG27980.1 GntR family transcriptional regulator, trehalose operon transcriptional repressor [Facklamia miroungae]
MHKFEMIYLDLKNKIKQGVYPIQSFLPSETDLAKHYKVSRETIRKAQTNLIKDGYLHKQKGKGAVVLDYEQFSLPVSGLTSYQELTKNQSSKHITQVILFETISVPDNLIGLYDLAEDEKFIHLVRTRSVNQQVLIVDEDYIRCKYVQSIPVKEAEQSLYRYFEQELKLDIAYAVKEFFAEKANSFCQDYMDISTKDYVITVKSHVFLKDTNFFQMTLSRHLIDRFQFKEIAYRRHSI